MAKLLPPSATVFNASTIAGTRAFGLMNYKMPVNYRDEDWIIYSYRKIFFTNDVLVIVQFGVAGPPTVEDDIKWYADKYRPLFGAMAESITFPNLVAIPSQHSWWDERCDATCDEVSNILRWVVIACLGGLISKIRKKKNK